MFVLTGPDVLTEEGIMLDQEGIGNIYSLKTNFLEFGIFKHRVGNYLNGFVNLNLQLYDFQRPIHSFLIASLTQAERGPTNFTKF